MRLTVHSFLLSVYPAVPTSLGVGVSAGTPSISLLPRVHREGFTLNVSISLERCGPCGVCGVLFFAKNWMDMNLFRGSAQGADDEDDWTGRKNFVAAGAENWGKRASVRD